MQSTMNEMMVPELSQTVAMANSGAETEIVILVGVAIGLAVGIALIA